MVIQFMEYVTALRASDLPGNQRAVAFWIASRCSNGWSITYDDIVADSGFSRATVVRAIGELEAKGWMLRKSDKKSGNQYETRIPNDENQKAHSEPTVGSQRAVQKDQREPTEGSQRAVQKAQSEPTYTRTKQEHIKKHRAPITTSAENDFRHKDVSNSDCHRMAREISRSKKMTNEVAQINPMWVSREGVLRIDLFATEIYTSERSFERCKGVLMQAKAAMTARGV
nr:MAG TPA: helix-turn-helix domain protein [Bacteriophage sp.]